jgi:glycosyltransferase involved in cell wall biosynthesis
MRRSAYDVVPGGGRDIRRPRIVGMIRMRNESLILQDTLDHLARHVDAIVVFDDASDDDSVRIAAAHPKVVEVIASAQWSPDRREWEETANRRRLHERAKRLRPEWLFYADADERFEGDIADYLHTEAPRDVAGIRISLFDAYLTADDQEPYVDGQLLDSRRWFGPERRDILMIWRNRRGVEYRLADSREPQGISGRIETRFLCQHYGKSISVAQWEATCRYYVDYFPGYADKWRARMGKAIHSESDFGRELVTWPEVMDRSVPI